MLHKKSNNKTISRPRIVDRIKYDESPMHTLVSHMKSNEAVDISVDGTANEVQLEMDETTEDELVAEDKDVQETEILTEEVAQGEQAVEETPEYLLERLIGEDGPSSTSVIITETSEAPRKSATGLNIEIFTKMNPIPGYKKNALCYLYKGYLFQAVKIQKGELHLKCLCAKCYAQLRHPEVNTNVLCSTRCRLIGSHNHMAQLKERKQDKRALIQEASDENRAALQTICSDKSESANPSVSRSVQKRRRQDGSDKVPLHKGPLVNRISNLSEGLEDSRPLKSGKQPQAPEAMMRCWKGDNPKTPDTLKLYGKLLEGHSKAGPYYKATVTIDGDTAVIFCIQDFAKVMENAVTIAIDATHRVLPTAPLVAQLFSIHVLEEELYITVLIALMGAHTTALYTKVLQWFQDSLSSYVENATWLVDYNFYIRCAVNDVFPRVNVQGCYTHYIQALIRKARSLKMIPFLQQEEPLRIFRMFQCLALMPPKLVLQGFEYVLMHIHSSNYNQFAPFIEYFDEIWIKLIGLEDFNVFDAPVRTNNCVELFQTALTKRVRVSGESPHIWGFTATLRRLFQTQEMILQKTSSSGGIYTTSISNMTPKLKYLLNERRLKEAQLSLLRNSISIDDFMNRVLLYSEEIIYADDLPAEIEESFMDSSEIARVEYLNEDTGQFKTRLVDISKSETIEEDEVMEDVPIVEEDRVSLNTNLCILCITSPISMLFLPCRHLCLCVECATKVQAEDEACPVCQTPVEVAVETIIMAALN